MEHANQHNNSRKGSNQILTDKNKKQLVKKILNGFNDYKPLIIIFIFCVLLSLVRLNVSEHQKLTYNFMGYFFVFLSLFKFFDLDGFVDSFENYDIVTQRVRAYGYFYPVIECVLGLAYLTQTYLIVVVNLVTVVVMMVSGWGVVRSILSGKKVQCACLGTTLNVPLNTLSVVENVGMGLLAAYNLLSFS